MTNEEDPLALYEWAPGTCFRCAHEDDRTTLLDRIPQQDGRVVEIRACPACILELEAMRKRADERAGRDYVPGHLASHSPGSAG